MRNTQEKFTEALAKMAEDAGLELVDDRQFSNTGFFRLEAPGSFDPVVKMHYSFQDTYASFSELHPGDLGDRPRMLRDLPGGPVTPHGSEFPGVRPEELETRVLSAVRKHLAGLAVDQR